jgi:hypothetical protein
VIVTLHQLHGVIELLTDNDWRKIEATLGVGSEQRWPFRKQLALIVVKRLSPTPSRAEAKARQKRIMRRRKVLGEPLDEQLVQDAIAELRRDVDERFLLEVCGHDFERYEAMHGGREPDFDNHAMSAELAMLLHTVTGKEPGYTQDPHGGHLSGPFPELVEFADRLIEAVSGKKPRANSTIGKEVVKPVVKHKDRLLRRM